MSRLHELASRLSELSRDSAAGPAARRLGIEQWETHSWTKGIIDLNQNYAIKEQCFSDYILGAADGREGNMVTNVSYESSFLYPKGVTINVGTQCNGAASGDIRCSKTGPDPICGEAAIPSRRVNGSQT